MPELAAEQHHRSVLLDETVTFLASAGGTSYIDATLGLGGHTEELLCRVESARVLGIDQDTDALRLAADRLGTFGSRFIPAKANFSEIANVASREGFAAADGIMADLGVSSLQFDSETRGFSFRFDSPLDMRMDPASGGETAAELLERLDEEELANVIYQFGEERASRKIARWIIEKRGSDEQIRTTRQLAELVKRAVPSTKDKIHPATRTFQALRIAVNNELEILDRFIDDSVTLLKTGGVLAIITFHSLEDRIVKTAFQRLSGKCQCPPRIPQCVCGASRQVEIITRKPVVPSADEINVNPRSRSAKLRVCRKA